MLEFRGLSKLNTLELLVCVYQMRPSVNTDYEQERRGGVRVGLHHEDLSAQGVKSIALGRYQEAV
jgi:hypothetical protein